MSKPTKSAQNKWILSDLEEEDRTTTRRVLTNGTEIVR